MRLRSVRASERFRWPVFRGRCRRNLLAGLVLCLLAAGYGLWAARGFANRGADARSFDRSLVRLAQSMLPQPAGLRAFQPTTLRELYLVAAISDQRDVLVGMTVFVLRLVVTLTIAGFGLILLTAGATEWEIRSERIENAELRIAEQSSS